MSEYVESLVDILFAMLGSNRNTATFKRILRERRIARYKQTSVYATLYRLEKQGYAENIDNKWSLTKEGKQRLADKERFSFIPSPFKDNQKVVSMISFDIPTQDRAIRNWLRNQIKIFGYKMIQQSLWAGPGPLPKNFRARLRVLGIDKKVKIFKIVEEL